MDNGLDISRGNFVNSKGEVLGAHDGIFRYTIGQRRGLGIQQNKPLFVSDIRADKNEILLEDYSALYKSIITINKYYFIDLDEVSLNNVFSVRIRYRLQNTPCTICIINEDEAEIKLLEPLAMVAKGQSAVFYDGDRVIGGGFIIASK